MTNNKVDEVDRPTQRAVDTNLVRPGGEANDVIVGGT